MTEFLNHNGSVIKKEQWYLSPDNRSFRYGDGFFETIKLVDNNILMENYHFERLFNSLETLKFEKPKHLTAKSLSEEIKTIAGKNNVSDHARIRLTFFRGEGGLYDTINHTANYIIQSWPLTKHLDAFNDNGLVVDFFPDAKKSADNFSSIKSNNFLCYAMAALWAKENKLNDAIILNSFNNIADATIANVFMVKDGIVTTPPLTDGPVGGVMRRHVLKCLREEGIPTEENSLTMDDLLQASEVFFTNAIYGIRWVKQVANSNYHCQLSAFLHKKFILPLFK